MRVEKDLQVGQQFDITAVKLFHGVSKDQVLQI